MALRRLLRCGFSVDGVDPSGRCRRAGKSGVNAETARVRGQDIGGRVRFMERVSALCIRNAPALMTDAWHARTMLGAPKAIQSLTLISGGFHDAFSPQVAAVDNIRQLVLKLLSRPGVKGVPQDGSIRLSRRVFERVSTALASVT